MAEEPAAHNDTQTPPPTTPPTVTPPPVDGEAVRTLTGERDSARVDLAAAQQRVADLEAQMAETNTADLQTQLTAANDRANKAEADSASLRLTQSLTGKVANPAAAARLVDADLKKEDGTVDTDKFLERYPEFKPAAAATLPAATAPNGGGGTQGGAANTDVAAAARTGDPAAINAAMDAALGKK